MPCSEPAGEKMSVQVSQAILRSKASARGKKVSTVKYADRLTVTDSVRNWRAVTDKNGNKIILSDRQIRMLDQAIIAADLIYKQLLTKPK